MPVNYTFDSFSFEDANGYSISPQVIEPVSFAFGDYKKLSLTYNRTFAGLGALTAEAVYFAPQLFGDLGTVHPSEGLLPSVSYQANVFPVTSVGGTQAETDMIGLNIPATQKLKRVTWAYSGNQLTISIYFYAASDLRQFLNSFILFNGQRLDSLSSQSGNNVYESASQQIGAYLFVSNFEQSGGLVSDGAQKLKRIDGQSWPLNTSTVTISGSSNPIFNGSYLTAGQTGNELDLSGSGFPLTADVFSASADSFDGITPTESKFFQLVLSKSNSFDSSGIEASGLGFDSVSNVMTGFNATYERSAIPQSGLSSVEPTDVVFSITHTGTVSKVKYWIQDKNAATQNAPFFDEASFIDISGSITSPAANVWEASDTIPAQAQNADIVIVVVFYDETGDIVNSFINEPAVTDEQAEPAYPDVQSKIEDYLKEFGDYVRTTVYDRLRFSVFLDKSSFNARSLTGGFDDNFKRWELQIIVDGLIVKRIKSEFAASEGAIITDTPTNYNVEVIKRMELAWNGETVLFQWYFFFDNGLVSDQIGFKQQVDVDSQTKDLVSSTLYDNSGTFLPGNELTSFCQDLNQTAIVRTESASDNYKQLAVLVLPTLQEEESFTGLLPQQTAANLSDVGEDWTGGFNTAKIDITGIEPDSIAIIGKQVTESFDFGCNVNIQYIDQS